MITRRGGGGGFVREEGAAAVELGQRDGAVEGQERGDCPLPVAVLVNRQTAGAAEALAAVLRETGAGLILGSRTAGQAMVAQEFPLKNGERLRIATAPVQLGDGSALAGAGAQAGHCGGGHAGG